LLDIQKWAISETIYKIGVSRALGSNRNFQQVCANPSTVTLQLPYMWCSNLSQAEQWV